MHQYETIRSAVGTMNHMHEGEEAESLEMTVNPCYTPVIGTKSREYDYV